MLLSSHHPVRAVITRPDKPGKRGKIPVPSPVKQLALTHQIPVLQPKRLRLEDLKGITADIMVVVAYGQLVKPDVLTFPDKGCINVHASLLPRWRGAAPIQRAILAGDRSSGICIMQMDEGLDTGDVICRRTVPIAESDTAGSLADKLAEAGCGALLETLGAIGAGSFDPKPQPEDGVTWADKITKTEARLAWHEDAEQLARCARAFNPDPIAYTFINGMRVKVWQARATDRTPTARPGEIVSFTRAGIEVACGRGCLLLTQVQLPVGKGAILSAADLINARRDAFLPGRLFESENR